MTDERKRSLNDADAKIINDNLSILEEELANFMARNSRSESYDMDSKSIMAAEIMINNSISQALYNLDEKGVLTQFSFNEMLYDNLKDTESTEQKNTTGRSYSVYTFSGNITNNERSWENEVISARNATNKSITKTVTSTESSTEISISTENSELATDFYTGVYENLANKDGVVATGDGATTVITMDNDVEISVEYDIVSDGQKGWKKKFKKAKNKVKKAASSVGNYIQDNGPKVYGIAMITAGVVILAVWYGSVILTSPTSLPVAISQSPYVTMFAVACITSGYMAITNDEYYFEGSLNTDQIF